MERMTERTNFMAANQDNDIEPPDERDWMFISMFISHWCAYKPYNNLNRSLISLTIISPGFIPTNSSVFAVPAAILTNRVILFYQGDFYSHPILHNIEGKDDRRGVTLI
jgi:hypothetical protein